MAHFHRKLNEQASDATRKFFRDRSQLALINIVELVLIDWGLKQTVKFLRELADQLEEHG